MDFLGLKNLVDYLTKNKTKHIEVIGQNSVDDSRYDRFYEGVAEGTFTSDEDAALHFFGVADARDTSFRRFRNRMIRQLINSVFFIDLHDARFSDRHKAFFNCYFDFSAAYILNAKGAEIAATQILENVIEQAIKYEFTDLAADISRHLRKSYARSTGNKELNEYYTKLNRKYEEKRKWELIAQERMEELTSIFFIKKTPSQEVFDLANQYLEELRPHKESVNTSVFRWILYQLDIIKRFASSDYAGIIQICDEFIEKKDERKNLNQGAFVATIIQKLPCFIHLKYANTEEADNFFEYCISLEPEWSFSVVRIKELHCYYCIHTRRYEKGLAIFQEVVAQERFKISFSNATDTWHILGQYFHILAFAGKIESAQVAAICGTYNYIKLVTETLEMADRDKDGLNIPIVFLPIVHSLITKEYQEFGRSLEAIEKYRRRYLDNETHRRSNSFLRMMVALSQLEYEEAAAQKKIQKELKILTETPLHSVTQSYAVEIIPYEDLWDMLYTKYVKK
jgi:hypothetical protein